MNRIFWIVVVIILFIVVITYMLYGQDDNDRMRFIKIFRVNPNSDNLGPITYKDILKYKLLNYSTYLIAYDHFHPDEVKKEFYTLLRDGKTRKFFKRLADYEYSSELAQLLANYAAFFGRKEELIYLMTIDTLDVDSLARSAASEGHIDIIRYLQKDIEDKEGVKRIALDYGYRDISNIL